MSMDTQKIADIRKVDLSVAANIDTVGPKRNATAVNNAHRETIASQTKAAEKSLAIMISPDDIKVANALQWLTEDRPNQLTEALTSDLNYASSASAAFAVGRETSKLSIAAQTLVMAAQEARQQLQDRIMRMLLEA